MLAQRVEFDLIHRRGYPRVARERSELRLVKVGDADGADEALVHEIFHGAPRFEDGDVRGAEDGALAPRERPVDEVQIEVVEAEIAKGSATRGGDVLGGVVVVPQLGGDEELGAWDRDAGGGVGDRAGGGLSRHRQAQLVPDELLIAVHLGAVDVPVAGVQRGANRRAALLAVQVRGAETHEGHLGAGAQPHRLHGHDG